MQGVTGKCYRLACFFVAVLDLLSYVTQDNRLYPFISIINQDIHTHKKKKVPFGPRGRGETTRAEFGEGSSRGHPQHQVVSVQFINHYRAAPGRSPHLYSQSLSPLWSLIGDQPMTLSSISQRTASHAPHSRLSSLHIVQKAELTANVPGGGLVR